MTRGSIQTYTSWLLVVLFIGIFSIQCISGGNKENPKKSVNKEIAIKQNKQLSKRIDHLLDSLENEIKYYNNDQRFDSLANIAIALAESSFEAKNQLRVYQKYFDLVQIQGKSVNFPSMVSRMEKMILQNASETDRISLWLSISRSGARLNYSQTAQKFALKALSDSELGQNTHLKIESYLALGKSFEIQKLYIEAYQNYLNASYLTETIEQTKAKSKFEKECLHHLFEFYRIINDFDHAAEYKLQHIAMIEQSEKIDTLEWLWAKLDLYGLKVLSKKYGDVEEKLDQLILEAEKKDHIKLKDFAFALYRRYLIQTDDLTGYHKIYVEKYPEELDRMKTFQPVIYHLIKAKLAEYKNDTGGAMEAFAQGKKSLISHDNPAFKSNFFTRYGQFLLKHKKTKEAKDAFALAYIEAEKIAYLDFMLETSYLLDSISGVMGDYEDAYKYAKINKKLLLEQAKSHEQEEFLMLELANESKQIELAQQKQAEQRKRTNNIQYFIISLAISLLFLIFLIVSRFKVPEWSIRGLGFFSVLMLFEFIILILDHQIHHLTHGAPLWIFIIKVLILTFLFPLHHYIEEAIIRFMMAKKMLWNPSRNGLKQIALRLWPWLGNKAH